MPYSIAIGIANISPDQTVLDTKDCSCGEAQKACMPPFVFSVPGQVNFRGALHHLIDCRKKDCASLRKKVRESMQHKLHWLFQEEVLLGCIEIQTFLYGTKKVINLSKKNNFTATAHHLSQCPHEPCSRLRRALLLTVRDNVSPNAHNKDFIEQ